MEELTVSEERVLELLGLHGWDTRRIGGYLYMSPSTVKVHLSEIFRKLGVENRTQAALWWVRQHPQLFLQSNA